jgi:(1->4)-alpha-D-glucan 1-alpha-D-glucosylmutase
VAVEKIVAPHEHVPAQWAVHGTTGYRFANVVNGLLIDASAAARLDRSWHVFAHGEAEPFDELSVACRHAVMDGPLSGQLTVLTHQLLRLAREDRRTRDFTLQSLREALAEVIAVFPVYRTYIVDQPSAQDRRFIDWALGRARRRELAADASVFDFLRRVLLGRPLPGAPAGQLERMRSFTCRLQQYLAPVAAKGIEDTALYRHHRLISVNDVGGEPEMFGLSVQAFHGASRDRAQHWPHTMLATSTHDAKRSEDVRCRIDSLSEMPAAWRLTARRWSRFNRRYKRTVGGHIAPTRNDEYMLYQVLLGSLPATLLDSGELDAQALDEFTRRIEQTMLKSAREAKAVTSWMNPHAAYEAALGSFVRAVLHAHDSRLFLDDLRASARRAAWYGALNGLSLALIKTLSPGVPDFYQGHEGIELSLVDPDNRRAVDFARRQAWLDEARSLAGSPDCGAGLRALLDTATDGRAKFWVTWRSLQLRRANEAWLRDAPYIPLVVEGRQGARVVAFARGDGARWIVAVAPRLYAGIGAVGEAPLGAAWDDTAIVWPVELDRGTLHNAIDLASHTVPDGDRVPLALLLREFPVAALAGAALAPDESPAAGRRSRAD